MKVIMIKLTPIHKMGKLLIRLCKLTSKKCFRVKVNTELALYSQAKYSSAK